jgi:hypothetical protein
MPDEYLTGIGIVGKQPPVPIGSAAVNLSGPNSHAVLVPSSPVQSSWHRSTPAKPYADERSCALGELFAAALQ